MIPADWLQSTAGQVVLVLIVGAGVMGGGECLLAIREMALNSRFSLPEGTRQMSRYDYGGMVVVGWFAVIIGAVVIVGGLFVILVGRR